VSADRRGESLQSPAVIRRAQVPSKSRLSRHIARPYSLARRRAEGQPFSRLFAHAVVRALVLIAVGIFQRSQARPQTYFTFEDVLTQIGLCG
jgi:hypothetical protein